MTQKNVVYCMSTRLACSSVGSAGVILCVTPTLVKLNDCPNNDTAGLAVSPGLNRPEQGYIYGNLDNVSRMYDECRREYYRYSISYNDNQLSVTRSLTSNDINGRICEGCLTNYVLDIAGGDVVVEERTPGFLTLRNQHGCEYTFARGWTVLAQNPTTGIITITYPTGVTQQINLASLALDCAAIVTCQTPVSVVDTQSVNLTGSGVSSHTIQADLKISADVGNQLQFRPDGVFAQASISPPASSDSLINNGNRTFTHTAANGTQITFCQGITGISGGVTPGQGIGANFVVKEATLSGCELTLKSAAEHTSFQVSGSGDYVRSIPADISTLGTRFDGPTLPAVINNPSPIRSLVVVGWHHNAKSVEFRTGWAGVVDQAETWAAPQATFLGVIRTHREVIVTVPPGGSAVVGPFNLSIQTTSGAANSRWSTGSALLVLHATTV